MALRIPSMDAFPVKSTGEASLGYIYVFQAGMLVLVGGAIQIARELPGSIRISARLKRVGYTVHP